MRPTSRPSCCRPSQSKAQILALANAGGDFINAMKAAKEFGINKTMKMAGLLVFINDMHSLGLANTEGLQLTDSWYWNQDDASRKFAKRFFDKIQAHAVQHPGRRLLGHHDLPEGRAGGRHDRRRQGDGARSRAPRSTTSTTRARSAPTAA